MTRRKRRRPNAPTLRKRPRTRRPSVHTARPGFCVLRPCGGGPCRATRPSAKRGAQTLPSPDRRTHEVHASAVAAAPWQTLTHKSTNSFGSENCLESLVTSHKEFLLCEGPTPKWGKKPLRLSVRAVSFTGCVVETTLLSESCRRQVGHRQLSDSFQTACREPLLCIVSRYTASSQSRGPQA